jgi:hypothetical protein
LKDIIVVYNDNHEKPFIKNAEQLTVKAAGTYSYHPALEGSDHGPKILGRK